VERVLAVPGLASPSIEPRLSAARQPGVIPLSGDNAQGRQRPGPGTDFPQATGLREVSFLHDDHTLFGNGMARGLGP
jgi:hypothetical protein